MEKKKYKVTTQFWFKKHNRVYEIGETGEFTDKEAEVLKSQGHIEEIKDDWRNSITKPIKNYKTK